MLDRKMFYLDARQVKGGPALAVQGKPIVKRRNEHALQADILPPALGPAALDQAQRQTHVDLVPDKPVFFHSG